MLEINRAGKIAREVLKVKRQTGILPTTIRYNKILIIVDTFLDPRAMRALSDVS